MKFTKLMLLLLLSVELLARPNPFSAINRPSEVGATSYKLDKRKNFSSTQTGFPSSARILKHIEIYYQNLDGSIEKIHINLGEKIDWHNMLVISSEPTQLKRTVEDEFKVVEIDPAKYLEINPLRKKKFDEEELNSKIKKSQNQLMEYKEFDRSDTDLIFESYKQPQRLKITEKSKPSKITSRNIFMDTIGFDIQKDDIFIQTRDQLLRDVMTPFPHRLTLDFKKKKAMKYKEYLINTHKIKNIVFTNHSTFYRMTIEFDGQYKHKIGRIKNGYRINIK